MKEADHDAAPTSTSTVEAAIAAALTPATPPSRSLVLMDVYRYARESDVLAVEVDGYPNYHHYTAVDGLPRLLLESGINVSAVVGGPDGRRRPVISLRSSPWKAGHETNPWHDVFDLDHGHVRYYGDHKPSTVGLPGATSGNRALLEAWTSHAGTDATSRALAPPILLYRAQSVLRQGQQVVKGHVQFCGLGILERLEYVVQRDPTSARSFPNIVVDVAVVDLASSGERLDMRFIADRRNATLTAEEALRHAPPAWQRWVANGRTVLPRIRRRVMSSRVLRAEEQLPRPNTRERLLLQELYEHFDGRKHAFELLAARVAAAMLTNTGGTYHEGWLTRAGGDGGMDFVGRLDIGPPAVNTPVVVLGQAKCISPTSSVSPDQIARVVARLRRGWLGVYVTTGTFSRQAQIEVIDDQYPVLLVAGRTLVEQAVLIAESQYGGDMKCLLDATARDYDGLVAHRRPEEVLGL